MNDSKKLQSHNDVLVKIAETIDISDNLFEDASNRYKSIGDWLEREGSPIKQYDPEIAPQGSFLLGTVIRPIGDDDEFDIDLVCKLNSTKSEFSMAELKNTVGNEVSKYADARKMKKRLIEGKRCWTLEYVSKAKFHMDIVPCLPDIIEQAIAITDTEDKNYNVKSNDCVWPVSNPRGYAIWFDSRQKDVYNARRLSIFESENLYASVDEVPRHKVKTPLQMSIQLLKRHRDIMFNNDDDKPTSIIITTLAAHAYNGEQTIVESLSSILKNMAYYIKDRSGVTWVENPVYPKDNIAGKWSGQPKKEQKFYSWLKKAQRDFGKYLNASHFHEIPDSLQDALSKESLSKVIPLLASVNTSNVSNIDLAEKEVAQVIREDRATKLWGK